MCMNIIRSAEMPANLTNTMPAMTQNMQVIPCHNSTGHTQNMTMSDIYSWRLPAGFFVYYLYKYVSLQTTAERYPSFCCTVEIICTSLKFYRYLQIKTTLFFYCLHKPVTLDTCSSRVPVSFTLSFMFIVYESMRGGKMYLCLNILKVISPVSKRMMGAVATLGYNRLTSL